jgi:hypothetical protein
MKWGVAGLYLSVKYKDKEYRDFVEKFTYSHCEDQDDICTFVIKVDDVAIVDREEFKTNKEWVVTWGYSDSKELRHSEKIFIEDIGLEISEKGIEIHVTGHDKASIYRRFTSKAIYGNTSLPTYLAKVGKDVGIKTYIDIPVEYPWDKKPIKKDNTPIKFSSDDLFPGNKGKTVSQRVKNQQTEMDYYSSKKNSKVEVYPGIYRDEYELKPSPEQIKIYKEIARKLVTEENVDPRKVEKMLYMRDRFYRTPALVQGNRTVKQVANQMAMQDPNGPYKVSGHSDTIVITKRNLNVKPLYRYELSTEPGELISFKPSMRKRSNREDKKKDYHSGGFDPINKSYSRGPFKSTKPEVRFESPNNLEPDQTWNLQTGQSGGMTSGVTKDYLNSTRAVRDNLAAPIQSLELQKVTIPQESPLVNTDGVVRYRDGVDLETSFHDPNLAAGNAANRQVLTEQEDSPGSLVVLGNPEIISGVAVYVGGVSKKFSSNYYITKATHELGSDGSYKTSCEVLKASSKSGKSLPISESIPKQGNKSSKGAVKIKKN